MSLRQLADLLDVVVDIAVITVAVIMLCTLVADERRKRRHRAEWAAELDDELAEHAEDQSEAGW